MMWKTLVGTVIGLFVMGEVFAAELTIEKGGPAWSIYLEKDAPDSVALVATELKNYVQRVTGAEMVITHEPPGKGQPVISLGDTAFAREKGIDSKQFRPDGFRILTGDSWIVIAGKDYGGQPMSGFGNPYRLEETYNDRLKISAFGDAGTQQGVYEFLRRFAGVRWYMPGPLGEVVPERPRIKIPPTDLTLAPEFEYRYPYFCFFSTSDDDALWYRRVGFGAPFPVGINHSFQLFLKYKDTHPEYFALIDGQRDFTTLSSIAGPGNLNLSEPGLVKQVTADIIAYFDENPDAMFFPVVPPDGMMKISEDPVSQAQIDHTRGEDGKFSNYVWGFIDKVARGVAEKHPDKLIGSIAYEHYLLPPTTVEKLSPNVVVMICKFLRRSMPDPKVEASTRESIEQWMKKADVIYCWEYYCDILLNAGWRGYPVLYPPQNIQADLKFLKGKVRGEMIEAETWTTDQNRNPKKTLLNDPGLHHLRLYVTSQLLWNPDLDLNAVLDEYYQLFYGGAEKEMKEFWTRAAEAWQAKSAPDPASVYPAATVVKMLDCLQRAKAVTEAGSLARKRVEMIEDEFREAAEKSKRLEELQKRTGEILLVNEVKPVDGKLTGSFWTTVPPLSLIDSEYVRGNPETQVRLAWSEKALKLALACFEPKMDSLKTDVTRANQKRGSRIWEDDSVEVFLQTPSDGTVFQFIINSDGAVYNARKPSAKREDTDDQWKSGAEIAVDKGPHSWTVEISIPWEKLGLRDVSIGTELKANFYRTRQAGGKQQQFSWAPLISGNFFAPDEFGVLKLSDKRNE